MRKTVIHRLKSWMRWSIGFPIFGVLVLCFGIILTSAPTQGSGQSETTQPARGTIVQVMTLQVEEEVVLERRFLGRIEARQEANLAFEFDGTIDQILVEEGSRIKEGGVLATMNTDALMSQRASISSIREATQAQVDAALAEVDRVRRLVSRGATPANRLVAAEAEVLTGTSTLIDVQRNLNDVELRLAKSQILAPFDGIVGALDANLGETVAAGQTIVSLFQDGTADFRVGVPTMLAPEDLQNTRILVNDTEIDVSLRTIRPDIDTRTNTRFALFEIMSSDPVSFGLTATLIAETTVPARGAWVPLDAMRPSAAGFWIILAVNEDMIAQSIAVEVQHLRENEAYVTGAFDTGMQIISRGAHKVVPGQTVIAN